MTTPFTTTPSSGWALVEIMGHRTRVGRVLEVEQFGQKMLRLVELIGQDGATLDHHEDYAGAAIFSLTPLDDLQVLELIERRRADTAWMREPNELGAGDDDEDLDDEDDLDVPDDSALGPHRVPVF